MSEQLPIVKDPQEQHGVDPSVLGGNIASGFDVELYDKKVALVVGALRLQDASDIRAQAESYMESLGGERQVESVDVWEGIKPKLTGLTLSSIKDRLTTHASCVSKLEEDKDVFDTIISRVYEDMKGTYSPTPHKAVGDATDLNIGQELDALVDSGDFTDPATLKKATETIRLLVVSGEYKLYRWGRADQLNTALELMEAYTEWVPGFDATAAGFFDARARLTTASAALGLDNATKRHYKYAQPGLSGLMSSSTHGLETLRRVQAHMYLREYDITVPGSESEQVETR